MIKISRAQLNESVVMNETLCRHSADYGEGKKIASFPDPDIVYSSNGDFKIFCPVCRKRFSETEKRLKKEIEDE